MMDLEDPLEGDGLLEDDAIVLLFASSGCRPVVSDGGERG